MHQGKKLNRVLSFKYLIHMYSLKNTAIYIYMYLFSNVYLTSITKICFDIFNIAGQISIVLYV